jgi:uncharacterized SAM-binding protein YcdF (DUF218 family)
MTRGKGAAVIWLLGHYPNTPETDERVAKACTIHFELGFPIWIFGSRMACFPDTTEQLIKEQLVKQGVKPEFVVCSVDTNIRSESLDTVQEAFNVAAAARYRGVETLICVTNWLQLCQIRALLRRERLSLVPATTRLRDWRWWYILARIFLIPLAFGGRGKSFIVLKLVRNARARWQWWSV